MLTPPPVRQTYRDLAAPVRGPIRVSEADRIAMDIAANAAKSDPAAFQRNLDAMQREETRMLKIMRGAL